MSELLSLLLDATGTARTTTCGHNAQSNGEIECWWRYWNRAMKFLSPSDYVLWPSFAQRICFAYNSVPHESNANISPFEMDFGSSPVSPFAPPIPLDDTNSTDDDAHDESQQQLTTPHPLSPALAADAIRISVAAFHRFAHAHARYMQQTTTERLNLQGNPTTFQLHDRVKIYVPPTHSQLIRTGRRAKHVVAWRGPCTITRILSPVTYEMIEDCSGRTFQRTIVNIRPFRATRSPPPPHHDMLSASPLDPGTIIAVRRSDDPADSFDLARLTLLTESHVTIDYLGTTNPNLRNATFKLVWIDPSDNRTVLKNSRPARNHTQVTGEIHTADLSDLLVATHLTLTNTGRLAAPSYQILHHLRTQLAIY
jgi:hypothetical protein